MKLRLLVNSVFLIILPVLLILSTVSLPLYAQQSKIEACESAGQVFEDLDCTDVNNPNVDSSGIGVLFGNIANILSMIIGFIAVITIIYAGLQYVSSSGDQQKIAKAKNTIFSAVAAIFIILFAQTIVRLIINIS